VLTVQATDDIGVDGGAKSGRRPKAGGHERNHLPLGHRQPQKEAHQRCMTKTHTRKAKTSSTQVSAPLSFGQIIFLPYLYAIGELTHVR
jgi:hypothetical protein